MKRALVLGGGGSLGAYEIGAWQALKECSWRADMLFGTSIGAINAALIAQDEYELARRLWDNITVDQVMEKGINLDFNLQRMMGQRERIMPFLRKYARTRGADISPLVALLKRVIDERRVRESGIPLGLVTVRFPSLKPVRIMLSDIPEGRLLDYLLASSACFPAFPMHVIDGESYLDGCYYDNLPIAMAVRQGAEEIVAVDPQARAAHPNHKKSPFVTYIHTPRPLGSILLFDRAVIARNTRAGYLDTLKAMGRAAGFRYTFQRAGLERYQRAARRFALSIARMDGEIAFQNPFTYKTSALLGEVITAHCGGRRLDDTGYLLRGGEVCAEELGIDSVQMYTLDGLYRLALERLPLDQAENTARALENAGTAARLSALGPLSRPARVATLLRLMQGGAPHADGMPALMGLLSRELAAACFLYEMGRETA